MNPTNRTPHERDACEALLDQVEHQLQALTTVSLDAWNGAPRECVDEFANECLGQWSLPQRRRHSGQPRGKLS